MQNIHKLNPPVTKYKQRMFLMLWTQIVAFILNPGHTIPLTKGKDTRIHPFFNHNPTSMETCPILPHSSIQQVAFKHLELRPKTVKIPCLEEASLLARR